MKKVRKVAATAVLGVAVVLSGCGGGNVVGGDGPRPGIAAAVGDTEITLDDVAELTRAYCGLAEADPQFGVTSRAFARTQLLQERVWSEVMAAFADEQGIEVDPPSPDLTTLPGWDDLTEAEQDALSEYVEARSLAQAVQEETEETPDAADFDVVINPKFDLAIEDGEFVPADDRLSVAVSDRAASEGGEPSPEELQDLPDAELCGQRPEAGAPPAPAG